MKSHWADRLIGLLVVALLWGLTAPRCEAQAYERMGDTEADLFGELAYVSGDYETMKNVRRYWVQEVQRLKTLRNMEFVLTGSNDAILKITVPARVLFNQSDSTFVSTAENTLRPLLQLVRGDEASASVIVVAYSDNNGSDRYLQHLTQGRAAAIHRWLAKQGVGPADVHSFGFGSRVPRTSNDNIRDRERNRRISFYFVPNKKLLKRAKKGVF